MATNNLVSVCDVDQKVSKKSACSRVHNIIRVRSLTDRVKPGDCTTIMGANKPEWAIFDVATMSIGAIPAGIYATSSPPEVWSF